MIEQPATFSCCLILLNYNGQHLLKDSVPSAVRAANALGRPCPVVVLDNQSTENDVEYLRANFPSVEVMLAEKNDFLFSFNSAIAKRAEDIVILLNNDMTFDEGFIAPLLPYFASSDVFAVTTKVYYANTEHVIAAKAILKRQNFWYSTAQPFDSMEPSYSFFASGGAAAYRRTMFLELGGFDPIFRPGYSEEVDLSYRAWKRGWKVIYEPQSIAYHLRSASFEKEYLREDLNRIIKRNHILMNVKNYGGAFYVLGFLLLLPFRYFLAMLQRNTLLTAAIIDSTSRIPLALVRRLVGRKAYKVRDEEIIKQVESKLIG